VPALGRQVTIAGVHQIGEDGAIAVEHDRPLGDGHTEVPPSRAVAALPLPVGPVAGAPERLVLERQQRRDVAVRHQPHVAPAAPVAPVGPAPGHVRLAPEGHRPGAPIPRLHMDVALVDELRH